MLKPPAKNGNAGQIVTPIVTSPTAAVTRPIKEQFNRPAMLLSDVVNNINMSEKNLITPKVLFHQWYTMNKHLIMYDYEAAHRIWNAAQENV